jgi:tetratricopeptide (TPR) repeat protein
MASEDPAALSDEGKRAFEDRQFERAADLFRRAAQSYTLGRAGLLAAEMQNNLSVALLQAGRPAEALEAVLGTDQVFAGANDLKRQGMAWGNQAAALEALRRPDEALAAYERAGELLRRAGEGELLAIVKKSAAGLRLKRGQVGQSALDMIGSLEAREKPSLFDRFLKFLLRLKPW